MKEPAGDALPAGSTMWRLTARPLCDRPIRGQGLDLAAFVLLVKFVLRLSERDPGPGPDPHALVGGREQGLVIDLDVTVGAAGVVVAGAGDLGVVEIVGVVEPGEGGHGFRLGEPRADEQFERRPDRELTFGEEAPK